MIFDKNFQTIWKRMINSDFLFLIDNNIPIVNEKKNVRLVVILTKLHFCTKAQITIRNRNRYQTIKILEKKTMLPSNK